MLNSERVYKIYNNTKRISVEQNLVNSYEAYVSAFNADVAESLLKNNGLNETYSEGVLTEGLKILMKEEIEAGKKIRGLFIEGDILKILRSELVEK